METHSASVAQLAERLTCNQQVVGSSPTVSSGNDWAIDGLGIGRPTIRRFVIGDVEPECDRQIFNTRLGGFPSGQRGQTVNLMALPSQVRILHPPLETP